MQKSRLEIVVETIISKGTIQVKDAAWRFLRSEAGRAEAEMVHVSHQSQLDIIARLGKIKGEDLAEYKTQEILKDIQKILSDMLSDCEQLATTMVTANILSGKIGSLVRVNLKGQQLLSAVSLKDSDRQRITRLVDQIVGRLQFGASLTLASVKNMLQVTAIRANMAPTIKPVAESKDKKDSETIKQEPVTNSFVAEKIDISKPRRKYKQSLPTLKEILNIKSDPLSFVKQSATRNVTLINNLRNAYFRPKDSPIDSAKQREEALKEINGSPAAKAVFDMNEMIRKQGLAAFTDKGGRRWSLENYCAMTTRTTASQSSNLGEVFADEEHDLYYIVPHGSSCPICSKYEGRVYSRSGTNPNYPPLASVFGKIDPNGSNDLDNTYMSIHPNCRHKIVKYVEQSHTKAQQEKIQRESNKPFEIDEKKKKEIEAYKKREKVQNDRLAAMREFQTYLQVMPPKDVCGNFIRFYEHKKKNDLVYKEVKRKYNEILNQKNEKR